MTQTFEIPFPGGARPTAFRLERRQELAVVVRALERAGAAAGLAIIGGADGMSEDELRRLRPLFDGVLAELARRFRAAVLDGGTDTGVMRLMGRARVQGGDLFPLVGVLPSRLAALPGDPASEGAPLEPNHTHFVLVPGEAWGDEAPWLAELNGSVGERAATVLVNGGEISRRDAELCVRAGRPLVVLAGSGRTADALAAAAAGQPPDPVSERIAATGLLRPVDVDDRDGLAWALDDVLAGRD